MLVTPFATIAVDKIDVDVGEKVNKTMPEVGLCDGCDEGCLEGC